MPIRWEAGGPALPFWFVHSAAEHGDSISPTDCESLARANRPTGRAEGFVPAGAISRLMTKERRPAIRMLRGWAVSVLREAGAIHECEEHGWAKDRADPHARERAIDFARHDPPAGVSADEAAEEIQDVLESIGDTCPECSQNSD